MSAGQFHGVLLPHFIMGLFFPYRRQVRSGNEYNFAYIERWPMRAQFVNWLDERRQAVVTGPIWLELGDLPGPALDRRVHFCIQWLRDLTFNWSCIDHGKPSAPGNFSL
jgi:hypothetical protein